MNFNEFLKYGGGNVVYIYHVAGLPFALTSGFITTDLSELIFGPLDLSSMKPCDDGFFLQGVMHPADRAEFSLDDKTGLIAGGNTKVVVDKRHYGVDWDTRIETWPSAFVGLPGFDFIPEIGATSGIGWAILKESIQKDSAQIKITDQTNSLITDYIDSQDYVYLWLGDECVAVSGYSGSGPEYTLTVLSGGGNYGRGCFRTRPQGHYTDAQGTAPTIVSTVPLGSIAGRPCYIWATVVDDSFNVVLDEGAFCVYHGRVQPHISVDESRVVIPVEHWINNLKQDFRVRQLNGNLTGYLFTRGDEGSNYTKNDEGDPDPRWSTPHLQVSEYITSGSRRKEWALWLCEKNSYVYFRNKAEVLAALRNEIHLCNTGDTNQLSGSSAVADDVDEYIDFGAAIAVEEVNGRLVISETRNGWPTSFFSGPLALMFDLCVFKTDEHEDIKRALRSCQDVEIPRQWGLSRIKGWAGDEGTEAKLAINEDLGGLTSFLNIGDAAYWYQNKRDSALFDQWQVSVQPGDTVQYWPVPEGPSAQERLYFTPETDLSALGDSGHFQLGNYTDNADDDIPARVLIGNHGSKGLSGDLPYLEIDPTSDYLWEYSGQSEPALRVADLNEPSFLQRHASLFWYPLLDEEDPFALSDSKVSVSASTVTDIMKAMLGLSTTVSMPRTATLDYVPDVDSSQSGQFESVDWTSMTKEVKPYPGAGHRYRLDLSEGKYNLLELLSGELQFHGVHMTLEPKSLGASLGGHFVIRFRPQERVNNSQAISEGRLIDSSVVAENAPQRMRHSKGWQYSQLVARLSHNGEDFQTEIIIDSQYARARVGGIKRREIDSYMSQVDIGKKTGTQDAAAQMLYGYLTPLLVETSDVRPVVEKRLTSRNMYYINLGRDALLTDAATYDLSTGERGVTDKPCTVKRVRYNWGKDFGMDVDLAIASSAVYGWAPTMIVQGTNTSVVTQGASGEVTITPDAHTHTPSGGRTDLSYFRNLAYNEATQTYEAGSSDPDFKILVMKKNDRDFTPVRATISSVNATAGTATLSMDTTTFTISGGKITEDLYIKFDQWQLCEPEQRRWFAAAGEDNRIGADDVALTTTDFPDYDMEDAGTTDWTASTSNTDKSKVSGSPSGSGSQVLKVEPSDGIMSLTDFPNHDFESGTSDWEYAYGYSDTTFTTASGTPYAGSSNVASVKKGFGELGQSAIKPSTNPFTDGTTYEFKIWYKSDGEVDPGTYSKSRIGWPDGTFEALKDNTDWESITKEIDTITTDLALSHLLTGSVSWGPATAEFDVEYVKEIDDTAVRSVKPAVNPFDNGTTYRIKLWGKSDGGNSKWGVTWPDGTTSAYTASTSYTAITKTFVAADGNELLLSHKNETDPMSGAAYFDIEWIEEVSSVISDGHRWQP